MDSEISQLLQEFGQISSAFKNTVEERHRLLQQIKLLRKENDNLKNNENSLNNSLISYKRLIAAQQAIISKLVGDKEQIKDCNEELCMKNKIIDELQDEKSLLLITFQREQEKYIQDYNEKIDTLNSIYDEKLRIKNDDLEQIKMENSNTIQELHAQIEQVHVKKDEQINRLVSEYEQQLHRAFVQEVKLRSEIKALQEKNRNNRIGEPDKSVYAQSSSIIQVKSGEAINDADFNIAKEKLKMFEVKRNRALEITTISNKKSFATMKSYEERQAEHDSENKSKPQPKKRKLFNKHSDYLED